MPKRSYEILLPQWSSTRGSFVTEEILVECSLIVEKRLSMSSFVCGLYYRYTLFANTNFVQNIYSQYTYSLFFLLLLVCSTCEGGVFQCTTVNCEGKHKHTKYL